MYSIWNIRLNDKGLTEETRSIYYAEQLAAINYFTALEDSGRVEQAFPSGDVASLPDWFKMIKYPSIKTFLVLNGTMEEPIAHMHFNNIQGYVGVGHFSLIPTYESFAEAVEIGKQTMNRIAEVRRTDGTPFLTTVLGFTPKTNRAALLYAYRVGFKRVTEIPDMLYIKNENRYVSAIMTKYVLHDSIGE